MWRAMSPSSNSGGLPAQRWAVTGATGLVGNNLVRTLIARGARVRVLARGEGRRELEGLDLVTVQGELGDPDALRRLVSGVEVVVHAAADVRVGFGGREAMHRVNVEGTRAICAAMPAEARLVHVSSVDALGMRSREAPADEDTPPAEHEGGVPYVDTKREADRVVRASGVDHVIVHPTYMIGPWDWRPSSGRMVLAVAAGQAIYAPSGGNNFVHVQDVVDALIESVRGPAGRAWILGNENLSYREAWTRIAMVVKMEPPRGELPAWAGRVAASFARLGPALGLAEGDVNAASIRMSFLPHYFDPARARRELGMRSTPLETAVGDAWAFFREQGFVKEKTALR